MNNYKDLINEIKASDTLKKKVIANLENLEKEKILRIFQDNNCIMHCSFNSNLLLRIQCF